MKFRGNTSVNLDAKNRLAIPTKYRESLLEACEGQLVLTPHPRGCLLLVPLPAWEVMEDEIMALPSNSEAAEIYKEWLVGAAEDLKMDSAGRILVSSELRQRAGVEKNLTLVGQRTYFGVWDKATHEARANKIKPQSGEGFVPPAGFEGVNF